MKKIKVIELSDFRRPSEKEYVVISEIAHVQPASEDIFEDHTVEVSKSYWQRATVVTKKRKCGERHGSLVALKSGVKTRVSESPREVLDKVNHEQIELGE